MQRAELPTPQSASLVFPYQTLYLSPTPPTYPNTCSACLLAPTSTQFHDLERCPCSDGYEYFPCRQAFHQHYDLRYAVRRYRLHKEMNMILICADLQKLHLIAFLYPQAYFFQYLVNIVVDH